MKDLPPDTKAYKKTPVFNQDTVPSGLLNTHKTKPKTWGKICVLKGNLLYVIEEDPKEEIKLHTGKYGVVEPQVPHHVTPIGDVEFYVEFYK